MKLRNRYFFLRHGQTIYQARRRARIYPWPEKSPISITKKGEIQIRKAAKELKKENIDLIFASDVYRVRQSAQIVAKELGLKIKLDRHLRDINLGVYRGGKKAVFFRDFPKKSDWFLKRPKGGESLVDLEKRMVNVLKGVDNKYKNKNILIVSHKDPLWILEGKIKGWSRGKLLDVYKDTFVTGDLRKIN